MKAFFVLLIVTNALLAKPIEVPREFYKGGTPQSDHPGYPPFVDHFSFRNIADHVIDEATETFNPDLVEPGDTIYVNGWYLKWFADQVHDKIDHLYILLSMDVGAWDPRPKLRRLLYDPKLAFFFCRNLIFSYHPKLICVPLGQDFSFFTEERNPQVSLIETIQNKPAEKSHLLYMCHYPRSFFGDRDKIVSLFENEPYCYSRNHSNQEWQAVSRDVFYQEMSASKFVISPIGLETDCARTWEAVVVGCIPIVEHTFLDPLYEDLPIVMIHDWSEINEEFLHRKYEEVRHKSVEKAYFAYWRDLIYEKQAIIRKGDFSASRLETTAFSKEEIADLKWILKKRASTKTSKLYIKGFLTAVRPLQLANELSFLSKIYLHDLWLNSVEWKRFDRYIYNENLLENKEKITLFEHQEKDFNRALMEEDVVNCFLDMTYYRSSLITTFETRHRLKKDLWNLYMRLPKGSLLIGNQAENTYVKEVLEQLVNEYCLTVDKQNSFWFIKRR